MPDFAILSDDGKQVMEFLPGATLPEARAKAQALVMQHRGKYKLAIVVRVLRPVVAPESVSVDDQPG